MKKRRKDGNRSVSLLCACQALRLLFRVSNGRVAAAVLTCMMKLCASATTDTFSDVLRGLQAQCAGDGRAGGAADSQQGLGIDPAAAAPLYVRNKVALKEKER